MAKKNPNRDDAELMGYAADGSACFEHMDYIALLLHNTAPQ